MRPESVYLLAGPEAGKRQAFVQKLRVSLAESDGAPPEEYRIYASETGIGELLVLLRNGSLFSTRRLVEYRGAELIKGKEDLSSMAAYIAAPSAEAVLLLVTESFYVEKALEEAVGKGRKHTFFEMFESEKPRWVANRLREYGLDADEGAIESILELVENESAALDSACSRLAVVFPKGTRLGEAEIEAAIARNRQEDAFSLFDRMSSGELDEALDVLDAVLADRRGDAIQIISAITWSFRRLEKLHVLLEAGEGFEPACYKLQIRSKTVQRQTQAAAKRYSRRDCERIIRVASEFDGRARSLGASFERALLQFLIYGIVVKKGELRLAEEGLFRA